MLCSKSVQLIRIKRKLGIRHGQTLTAPRSPCQNAFAERVIGSISRDCLDHVIVLIEQHLKRELTSYFNYYHRWRTHLSREIDSPESRRCSRRLVEISCNSGKLAACIIITNG